MSDIVERLRSYEASRIAKQTSEAADTIEALRAENARLRDLLDSALGWLDDKEHDEPLLSVDSIRAARAAMGESDDYAR